MFHVVFQEENKIELALNDTLTKEEFTQIIHQLESLCRTFGPINVLFDASQLAVYDFKILIDEFSFFREFNDKVQRIALVSDMKFETFLANLFKGFIDMELKTFKPGDIESARKWIFPSPLP